MLFASTMLAASARPSQVLGGEWAGWVCSFDMRTGAVQPVPDAFVSAVMQEYDQVPRGFEECVTEEWQASSGTIARRIIRFLPEDGCSIEDLGAIVTREALAQPNCGATTLTKAPTEDTLGLAAWAIDSTPFAGRWKCESVFSGHGGVLPRERRNAADAFGLRTRVLMTVDAASGGLVDGEPIVVSQERCWSIEVSSDLQVREAVGGRSGIDGAWVSRTVGLGCFGERPVPLEVGSSADGLHLPGGVRIVTCADGKLQVSLDAAERRVVLSRTFLDGACRCEYGERGHSM